VHAATLKDGRKVAVKVLRPGARPLLRADVANLQRFSKLLADQLPVDYYTVFSELGDVLEDELDFLVEARDGAFLGARRGQRGTAPLPRRASRADASSARVEGFHLVRGRAESVRLGAQRGR